LGPATAQPPGGRGGRPPANQSEPKKEAAAKPDPTVDAWVKILGENMTARHDTVRESARAALVAIGKPALPALRKLAESNDSATALAASKVIERIEARPGVVRRGQDGLRPGPRGAL